MNLKQIPLYFAEHPDSNEVQEIEEICEKTIKVEIFGATPLYTHSSVDYLQMVELFNKAIAKAPDDPDLLYARSSLHYFAQQGEDGQKDRNRVLELSPGHFDAVMNKEYFKSWDSLFSLPAWNEKKTKLPDLMSKHIELGHYAQVVRDHLRGAVAIVLPENSNIGLTGCTKIRWDLKWVNTILAIL